ncbi:class I SAM-dependent methyltransferase [Aurantivibrio plasticivorans]
MLDSPSVQTRSSGINEQTIADGQAVYSRTVLAIYDWWVLGVSNHYIWKCPTHILREEFKKFASANHLDIGVGTGYYLQRCLLPTQHRLALMDLNENSLRVASARSGLRNVELYQRNVLVPFDLNCPHFDSISMNYLLHCIPGSMAEKLVVMRHAADYLQPGGVLYGSTILSQGVCSTIRAKKLMNFYNKKGIFHNAGDNKDALENGLREIFDDVECRVEGCVAIFSARKPA